MAKQTTIPLGGVEGEPVIELLKQHGPKSLDRTWPQIIGPVPAEKADATDTSQLGQQVLTRAEARQRNECEAIVGRGWDTFLEVGQALVIIRDHRLYRDQYATFEDYCRQRWDYSKTHANRLVDAAAVAAVLTPIGVKVKSESQLRPLVALPPQKIPAAWKRAQELAGDGPLTAKIVRRAVEEFRTLPLNSSETPDVEKPRTKARPTLSALDLIAQAEKAAQANDHAAVLAALHDLREYFNNAQSTRSQSQAIPSPRWRGPA